MIKNKLIVMILTRKLKRMINPQDRYFKKFQNMKQEKREGPSLGMVTLVVVLEALKAADTENYKNR